MGTRNLTVVILNKKVKVAQYCQWDGGLESQGKTIAKFLNKQNNMEKFTKAVSECKFITDGVVAEKWEKLTKRKDGMASMDESDKFKKIYPELHRDTGAEILQLIKSGKARELANTINFAGDSVFCEWAYIIDLDKKCLEIYWNGDGIDKKDRFASLVDKKKLQEKYSPVRLLKKIPFKVAARSSVQKVEKMLGIDTFLKRYEEFVEKFNKKEDE